MSKFRLKNSKGTLLKNTMMLSILQLSTYFLSLIAVPYETRVLTPSGYGVLGVATAIMVYFQLVIDFGFMLSATAAASEHREDNAYLRQLMTSVTIAKLLLAGMSAVALVVLCRVIPAWQDKMGLFFLFFLSTVFVSLMPDYLYRGLEHMTAITVRTVAIRAFFTVAIFVFLKKPEDLYVVPVLNIIGNGCAAVLAYVDLAKRFKIRFCCVCWQRVTDVLKKSSTFFYSRIATTAYTAFNTIILDVISAGGVSTGYYTAADKLITTGKNVLSPISDSLYPYMVRNKDYKLVKKILLVIMPIIIIFCTACFIWAEPLCILLLGKEYGPAGDVLRAMLPVGIIVLPNYILGFPTLGAMGLSKYANYSVVFGAILHGCNLVLLYLSGNMNMVTLGVLVSVAEAAILVFRIAVIWKHRDRLHEKESFNG